MKVVKQICWLGLILAWNLDSGAASIYQDRADGALQSFLVKFWNGSYLRNRFPDDGSLTGYWTYAHGWDAVMDGVERTSKKEYFGLIESFYLGQNERGWIVGYYDDECWTTMALLRAYDLTADAKYLNQAKTLYADIKAGWDTSCCGAVKGGLWWDKAHTQKATAANAGAATDTAIAAATDNTTFFIECAPSIQSTQWRRSPSHISLHVRRRTPAADGAYAYGVH